MSKINHRASVALRPTSAVLQFSTSLTRTAFFLAAPLRKAVYQRHHQVTLRESMGRTESNLMLNFWSTRFFSESDVCSRLNSIEFHKSGIFEKSLRNLSKLSKQACRGLHMLLLDFWSTACNFLVIGTSPSPLQTNWIKPRWKSELVGR